MSKMCAFFYLVVVPIVLVGNKKDIPHEIGVGSNDDESNFLFVEIMDCLEMSRNIGAYAYLECSAKRNNGIDDVYEVLIRLLKKKMLMMS